MAGNESVWGQRGDEGIEYRTLVGDDKSGRQTTMQVPTNDWSSKAVKAAGNESVGDRMTVLEAVKASYSVISKCK